MGRRRRRVIRIVKKKLPTVFVCPRCGEEAVRVSIDKQTGHAVVACAICQLKDEFEAHPQAQAIDVYSYFTDRFYGVKDPRAIIPRDRHPAPSLTEEEEESEAEEPIRPPIQEPSEPSLEEPRVTGETQPDIGSSTEGAPSIPSETRAEAEDQMNEEKREEEENPFGDILQSGEKEKKRYSSHPIEQESSTGSSSQ